MMKRRSMLDALLKSEISQKYLHTSDPKSITSMLRRGGRTAGLARTWFANVKERKNLINIE